MEMEPVYFPPFGLIRKETRWKTIGRLLCCLMRLNTYWILPQIPLGTWSLHHTLSIFISRLRSALRRMFSQWSQQSLHVFWLRNWSESWDNGRQRRDSRRGYEKWRWDFKNDRPYNWLARSTVSHRSGWQHMPIALHHGMVPSDANYIELLSRISH